MTAAFYCVSDDRYFLGAVGLVNSLRLVGHEEPIYLLDCGLTPRQRELLEPEVSLVRAPEDTPPTMLKTIAPLEHPAETMVLIDTDMIATRSFAEVLEAAGRGRVVAFRNDVDRYVPEWGELLDLGPQQRHPYVSFGMVAMDGERGEEVLRLIADRQARVDFERTYWREQRITGYPFLYADQDVLNAVLAARVEPERLDALDQELSPLPPFEGVRVLDERTLRCGLDDGREPLVIHHWLVKPWLEPTHDGVYSRLLRRLLTAGDLPVRVPEGDVPLRLRRGPLAFAERQRVNLRERWRYHVREPLSRRSEP